MVKKQLFFTILSGIIVATLLSFFSVTQGLFLTPQFEIDVDNLPDNSTKVTIKNSGVVQAKNALVFVDNSKNIELKTNTCYEGNIIDDQKAQYTIKFEKMSINVECDLFFNGNFKHQFSILVVADDSPGKSWDYQNRLDNSSFIIFTILPIILGGTILFMVGSMTYFVYSTIINRKRQENFKNRELELEQEIKSLQQEKRLIQRKQGSGRDQEEIERDNKRRESLDEQISELSVELDEMRTKMLSNKKIENNIGKFYSNWALFERAIVRLAEKYNISSTMAIYNSGVVMRKIFASGIIESEVYSNYQNVRRFRNNIAHGLTIPTNKELENKLNELTTLQTKIQELCK